MLDLQRQQDLISYKLSLSLSLFFLSYFLFLSFFALSLSLPNTYLLIRTHPFFFQAIYDKLTTYVYLHTSEICILDSQTLYSFSVQTGVYWKIVRLYNSKDGFTSFVLLISFSNSHPPKNDQWTGSGFGQKQDPVLST